MKNTAIHQKIKYTTSISLSPALQQAIIEALTEHSRFIYSFPLDMWPDVIMIVLYDVKEYPFAKDTEAFKAAYEFSKDFLNVHQHQQ